MFAVYPERVHLLFESVAVNAKNLAGFQLVASRYASIVRMLLAQGAHADEEDPETGSTPLNEAARKGHTEIVQLLLEHGADPARRDHTGATPLENAAHGRHAEVMDLLLKPGSAAAAQAGPLLIEAAIKGQTEVADLLISKGSPLEHGIRTARRRCIMRR